MNPKNFFLNETHELVRSEKSGGGRFVKYSGIDWAVKAQRIEKSLNSIEQQLAKTKDPLKGKRYFIVANPEKKIEKESANKKKAPQGKIEEITDYSGLHSRVFRKLGIDLINVHPEGTATVHATVEQFQKLVKSADALENLGDREQAKWATINSFGLIPRKYRIDAEWLNGLSAVDLVDVVFELQPILTRIEVDTVFRELTSYFSSPRKEKLIGSGADFSGRHWAKGQVSAEKIRKIADDFFSVQSIHAPMLSDVAAKKSQTQIQKKEKSQIVLKTPKLAELPTVAVVDVGVRQDHEILAPYCKGRIQARDSIEPGLGDHGCFVSSRVVFGDLEQDDGFQDGLTGTCQFLDVSVAAEATKIDDKSVISSMENVVAAYPDVRVFNLSFGSVLPLAQMDEISRRETLSLLRDLDNFIFANDVIVVVSSGNSPKGVLPSKQYPQHFDLPEWKLGSWSMGFNSLVCGSLVIRSSTNGVARNAEWPSPFSRVGPGIADAPVPNFGSYGGDCGSDYQHKSGLGVFGFSNEGDWEDRPGTSFASPILAREAAFTLQLLQRVCEGGARPYSVTAKAFLNLVAGMPDLPVVIENLAKLTVGRGKTSSDRLENPSANSGVFIWQGILEDPNDIASVQIPIPADWLENASLPSLRLVCCWDTPVNDTAESIWGCRKVSAKLRSGPNVKALRGRGSSHHAYPVIDRVYDLSKNHLKALKVEPSGDIWFLEMSFDEIADYYPTTVFTPNLRIAFCAELVDKGSSPVSPQASVQALKISQSMTRLAVTKSPVASPVVLKFRR